MFWCVAVLCALAATSLLRAQVATSPSPATTRLATTQRFIPSVLATRVNKPPIIDGKLDDACWRDVPAAGDFLQVLPTAGIAPTERTEFRVCYDDDNLYIAIRCFDSDPREIRAKQMKRDSDFDSDDVVGIVIDTFHNRRSGYYFGMSAAGAKRDGLVESGQSVRLNWDGIWHGKTSIDDLGWCCEVAIPFKTLSFDKHNEVWGLNVSREIRRKQEIDRWACGDNPNSTLSNLREAGTIEGLRGMRQGHGISFVPYALGKADFDDNNYSFKSGFDLYYQLTPSVTAALTVNTDFAETEVDERQVNLTRFPLFFPEKRGFFLQDANIFSFGGIDETPLPFFSRRIGIVNGVQKDILAGLKITGRQDRLNFGLLDVQMHDDRELGAKNLSVARASVNVLEESSVGVIATHGDPATTGDNTLGGVDFNFRNSHVNGDKVVSGGAWFQQSHSTLDQFGDDVAFGGRVSYPNDRLSLFISGAQIGSGFDPALGFTERTGVRNYENFARARWRFPSSYVRRIDLQTYSYVYTDMNNSLQSLFISAPETEFEDKFGDECGFGLETHREVLTEPFEIHDGVTIPTGGYTYLRPFIWGVTTRARPVSVFAMIHAGDFYNGRREDYEGNIEFRPTPQFFGRIGLEFNDVHLPEGDFVVRIIRARGDIIFSPEVSWSNTIQYDNVSHNAGLNSRLRYEFEPGREMFVVLNQGFDVIDNRFKSATSELTVKVGLTFRF